MEFRFHVLEDYWKSTPVFVDEALVEWPLPYALYTLICMWTRLNMVWPASFVDINVLYVSIITFTMIVLLYISIDINECASQPCLNGGQCTDGVNQYTCTCAPGWEGTNCDISKNAFYQVCYNIFKDTYKKKIPFVHSTVEVYTIITWVARGYRHLVLAKWPPNWIGVRTILCSRLLLISVVIISFICM